MPHGDISTSERVTMLKTILLNAVLKAVQDLIASGKINEYLKELVNKLVGVQGGQQLPNCVGCELKGEDLCLKFDDGREVVLK